MERNGKKHIQDFHAWLFFSQTSILMGNRCSSSKPKQKQLLQFSKKNIQKFYLHFFSSWLLFLFTCFFFFTHKWCDVFVGEKKYLFKTHRKIKTYILRNHKTLRPFNLHSIKLFFRILLIRKRFWNSIICENRVEILETWRFYLSFLIAPIRSATSF